MNSPEFSNNVRRRFSASAETYHARSRVQPQIARRLIDLLPRDLAVDRLLELGCGSGKFTQLLRERWPKARIDAIDLAPGMIDFSRRTHGDNGGVRWLVADAANFRGENTYDLIASNCALHWIENPAAAFRHLAGSLAASGLFAFSIMLDGTLAELHEARRSVAPDKAPLGRLPTMAETLRALDGSGLLVRHAAEETMATTSPSAAALLRSIHEQGLTGGRVSRARAPLNRQELDDLIRFYDDRFKEPDGSVRVTYRAGYLVLARSKP